MPRTQTGGCLPRSKSTKCSVMQLVMHVKAGLLEHFFVAVAAAPAASIQRPSMGIYRRMNCISKAARMVSWTEGNVRKAMANA